MGPTALTDLEAVSPTRQAFDGESCLGTQRAARPVTPSDQSDAALWLHFTTAFFNKAIKEQDVPFDTPPAQPACAVGGHPRVRNRREGGGGGESWLKRGVIWRLATESDWALADKDDDSLRAKHRDGFCLFFFLSPGTFQVSVSLQERLKRLEAEHSFTEQEVVTSPLIFRSAVSSN